MTPVLTLLCFRETILLAFPRCLTLRNMVIRNVPIYLLMPWLRYSSPQTRMQVPVRPLLLAHSRISLHEATVRFQSLALPLTATTLSPLWKEVLLKVAMLLTSAPLRSYRSICSSCCIMVRFRKMISSAGQLLLISWIMSLYLAEHLFLIFCAIIWLFWSPSEE